MKKIFNIRTDLLICLFIVLATVSVYWQVRDYDFVNFDDDRYVYENRYVRAGLTRESVVWAFTAAHAANWHPVTWLSHIADVTLYGLNPGGHHITSVIFHIANTLLLFFLLARMTGALWPGAFVAALFALHPLHAESVAWVAERKDVLSTFFWLLTLQYYVRYTESHDRTAYLITIIFFVLGLMSKPMVVTLPFVLLLLDYWPLGRLPTEGPDRIRAIRSKLLEKLPFFALSAVSSAITFFVQQSAGAMSSVETCPFHFRLANALVSYVAYIVKMVYPYPLAVLYPHPGMQPWWKIAGASLILAFLCISVIRYAKSHPYLIVGWLWYTGTLVPVIGLVQVGTQSMADRYTYIPLIGLFMIIAWGTPELARRWRYGKLIMTTTAIVFLALFTLISWLQTGYWANTVTLLKHTVEVTGGAYRIHAILGTALAKQGKTEEAIKHYYEALRISPDMAADIHNNIAAALIYTGQFGPAMKHIQESLRADPGHIGAHRNLKILTEQKNRFSQ